MKQNAELGFGRLSAFTLAIGMMSASAAVGAQEVTPAQPAVAPTVSEPAAAAAPAVTADDKSVKLEKVQVTGSRIQRSDYSSNSPVVTVTREAISRNADVTLDTYLNTLPAVNPAGTTTSNNPGNGGQSNIDLRGLGANRNLVLVDGRRPMVSSAAQTVDLNTIPQALIDRIEIVTGGGGAVYGADAVAGAVNIKLKRNFQGLDLRSSYSDSDKEDGREKQFSGLLGGNFDGKKGNAVLAFDYAEREGLIKAQRDFASIATSTTSFNPEGVYLSGGNNPTQASVDGVFGTYGVAAGAVPAASNLIGFNLDGTLFSRGIFNSPRDVQNFRYPIDSAVNTRLFPDFYSYNFDAVNILVLPVERRSFLGKLNYDIGYGVEAFGQFGHTRYTSTTALAPSPISTVTAAAPGRATSIQATSALVTPGRTVASSLIVPTTNPFIPSDFRTVLNSRTGDNAALVGSGATEPFLLRQRTLSAGLRESNYENTVFQYQFGLRGDLPYLNDWNWEAYVSEGRTKIIQQQTGNIDTNRLQSLLEAADGGASVCAGGFNPFGRNPISPECVEFLEVNSAITTSFLQRIAQGFVTGPLATLPAGSMQGVLGLEYRGFRYELDPGASGGPISGFNAQVPAGGKNSFRDIFGELSIPLLKDRQFAQSLDLGLGFRTSESEFQDTVNNISSDASTDNAYKVDLSWKPIDLARLRASYQRSVRAPNFGELFDGGGSAPQIFDPCSVTTQARRGADGAALRQLCIDTGLSAAGADVFVQTPGGQASITTTGNTNLQPEKADTITTGLVLTSPWGGSLKSLQASVDYYYINIKDPILAPSVNGVIASCYNYYGSNPGYSATNEACQTVFRAGGDILALLNPNDPNDNFPGINGGKQQVSGLDLQVDYGFDLANLGMSQNAGKVAFNLLVNHVLSAKQKDSELTPVVDYADTVSFFGEGLGTSFPEWRMTLNTRYSTGPLAVDLRTRYIDGMKNRASALFPGETQFTGVGAVTYWDLGASVKATKAATIRLGVNNVFDKQPPVYAPNVQSGTDPSTYDVIGRRFLAQLNLNF